MVVERKIDVQAFANLLEDEIISGNDRSIQVARDAIRFLDIENAVNDLMDEKEEGAYVRAGPNLEGRLSARIGPNDTVDVYIGDKFFRTYIECEGGDIPDILNTWVYEDYDMEVIPLIEDHEVS